MALKRNIVNIFALKLNNFEPFTNKMFRYNWNIASEKSKNLTDGRSDDKQHIITKAHLNPWCSELMIREFKTKD